MADCNGGSAAQEKSRGSPEFVHKVNPMSQLMLAETLDRVSMFATVAIDNFFPRHNYVYKRLRYIEAWLLLAKFNLYSYTINRLQLVGGVSAVGCVYIVGGMSAVGCSRWRYVRCRL